MTPEELLSRHVSPFDRGYLSYHDHLVAFNRKIQDNLRAELPYVFENFEGNIAIATTGSDARLEKGPVSPIEIITLGVDHSVLEKSHLVLKSYINKKDGIELFDDDIEYKHIDSEKLYDTVLRENGIEKSRFTSPNRFLDARLLFSKNDIYRLAKKKFVEDIISNKKGSLLKSIKRKLRDHSSILDSGVQNYKERTVRHFDFDSGIAFYNPDGNSWSFKQSHLRTVQYALVRDSIKFMRGSDKPEMLFSLPKNTVEKLNQLEVEGLTSLSGKELEELSDCYKYFLHMYHKSQSAYRENGVTELEFDSVEAKERSDLLKNICSKPLINSH